MYKDCNCLALRRGLIVFRPLNGKQKKLYSALSAARLEALSHPLASVMRFMDAYLLSAAVGCGEHVSFLLPYACMAEQLSKNYSPENFTNSVIAFNTRRLPL